MNSKLLAEAIADSKAIKAVAMENARIALSEVFGQKLEGMLSKKIQEEEGELAPETTEEVPVAPEAPIDAPVSIDAPVVAPTPEVVPSVEAPVASEPDGDEVAPVVAPAPVDGAVAPTDVPAPVEVPAVEAPVVPTEEPSIDSELEEILKELENDAQNSEDNFDIDKYVEKDSSESSNLGDTEIELKLDDEGPADDEVNLDELLAEIEGSVKDEEKEEEKEEDEKEELDETVEGYKKIAVASGNTGTPKTHNHITAKKHNTETVEKGQKYGEELAATVKLEGKVSALEAELKEYKDGVVVLRNKLNEVNLLNAKLLYTNKLFKGASLTNEQKVKVIESFDRSKDVREVKLVYSTLMESFKNSSKKADLTKKVSITEGIASKPVASTKPLNESVAPILTEANAFSDRMKVLAGITK